MKCSIQSPVSKMCWDFKCKLIHSTLSILSETLKALLKLQTQSCKHFWSREMLFSLSCLFFFKLMGKLEEQVNALDDYKGQLLNKLKIIPLFVGCHLPEEQDFFPSLFNCAEVHCSMENGRCDTVLSFIAVLVEAVIFSILSQEATHCQKALFSSCQRTAK